MMRIARDVVNKNSNAVNGLAGPANGLAVMERSIPAPIDIR